MNKFDIIELGQQTMQFTYDTFNGKVNHIDPYTKLIFVSGYLEKMTNIARTSPYGYIYVSLDAFYDTVTTHPYHTTDAIRNLAMEIIIHELTHVDQLIDLKHIKYNIEYRQSIEEQCVKKSCEYILDNIGVIQSVGLPVFREMYEPRYEALKNVIYFQKYPELVAMVKLESIIGPSFKLYVKGDVFLDFTDKLGNNHRIMVAKDRQYINSQALNDICEFLFINKNFNIELKSTEDENLKNTLEIKITQGV